MNNEFELIQSNVILTKVIESLSLSDKWRQRDGKKLNAGEALAILKARLELRPVRCTSLVEIHITNDDPVEAAEICNAVAEQYRNYRPVGGSSTVSAALVDVATAPRQAVAPNRMPAFCWLGIGTILAVAGVSVSAKRARNELSDRSTPSPIQTE